jgi:septum formation protein
MRTLSALEIAEYLRAEEWRDKAGAYGIQGRAGAFVTRVAGCYYNVVGLPMASVCARLRRLGIWP